MLRSEDPELYLEKAVHRLCDYYGKALTLEYVRNKIAWALYQTWKEFDKKSEERRMPPKQLTGMTGVTLCYADGTKIEGIAELETIMDFIEEHQEYVRVVRCKNCKHYHTHDRRCKVWNHGVGREEFCSRGEWKDDPSHPFADDVMMG